MNIWILDDNSINCYVLKELLSEQDCIGELSTYTDSMNFTDTLIKSEKKPDVILTDIMMPGKDGYEITTIVRELFPSIRMIGVTALPRSKDLSDKVHASGMETVIFKPYDMSSIIEYLKVKR